VGPTAAGRAALRGGAGRHPQKVLVLPFAPGVFWCLPDSSSVVFVAGKFRLFMQLNPHLYAFWNNLWKNNNSLKLVEIISNNFLFYDIYTFHKEF
jgi:hypothetical protein